MNEKFLNMIVNLTPYFGEFLTKGKANYAVRYFVIYLEPLASFHTVVLL